MDANLLRYSETEQLSLFVKVDDADGRDEINDIYVYFDRLELIWHRDAGTWDLRDESDGYWVGTSGLFMPGGAPFPSGSYRVVVVDLSGRETESFFTVPGDSSAQMDTCCPRIVDRNGIPGIDLPGSEEVQILLLERGGDGRLYRAASGELSESDRRILADSEGYFVENRGIVTRLTPLDRDLSE